MNIDIKNFQGLFPSTGKQLLDPTAATVAYDCRIGSGELRPLYQDRQDHLCPSSGIRSFYLHHDTWLHHTDKGRRYVPGPVWGSNQKLYMSKATGGLYLYHGGTERQLGVPAPILAPVVAAEELSSGGTPPTTLDTESRVYVYTWVNSLGEESAPSPPSAIVNVDIFDTGTQSVEVSSLTTYTGSDYFPITKVRIYRLAVGNETSGYFFVTELTAGTTTFIDTVDGSELGEELITNGWSTPDAALTGLTSLPGGVLAAFKDNEVWLSEANYPYAWPVGYMYNVEYPIVQLAACGRVLFVLTTGRCYRMVVDSPDSAVPVAFESITPCLSADCAVPMPSGVLFPSNEGLYLASADGSSVQLVSGGYYDQPDWQKLTPSQMFGAWTGGVLYVAHPDPDTAETVIKMFDFSNNVLTASDVHAEAFAVIPEYNRLFYLKDGGVWEWEGNRTSRRTMEWRSKDFMLANPANFAGFLVEALYPEQGEGGEDYAAFIAAIAANNGEIGGGTGMLPCADIALGGNVASFELVSSGYENMALSITFFADNRQVFDAVLGDQLPSPLPSGFQARRWAVRVRANIDIRRVVFGQSMGELYYGGEE